MRALAVVALAAVILAGCSGGKAADSKDKPGAAAQGGQPMLHGFVFDDALRPLAGATVKVLDNNASTPTDKEGGFGFADLPAERFLVVVATHDGFVPTSKQVTLTIGQPVLLNFTLQPVPTQLPYLQKEKHDLLVECQVGLTVSADNRSQDCGTGTQGEQAWNIAVGPGLAGAVIEVFWTPTTDAAKSVGAKLETLELGQLNLVLGQVVGPSPLRILVPQTVAERYYVSGGMMRLSVYAAPDSAQNEAGVGASALLQQPLTAYSTQFFVAPPDPSYTIADG
jgi:hypothetical protein